VPDPDPVADRVGAPVTRRAFIGALSTGAALALGCRRAPYDASLFQLPHESPVALLPAASYDRDLGDIIHRGLQLTPVDVAGRRVLLKPNVVEHRTGAPINTDPAMVAGAAEALLRAGAREVVVAEGPGHRRDCEYLLEASGLMDVLTQLRLRFVDLNHDDVKQVTLRSRFTGLTSMRLPVELLRSDVIVSMPKLKTHHWAGMTCGMKNLFGVVPGGVYGWPKNVLHWAGIDNSLVDLTATVRPSLTIVDAITSMEGDGPIMGRARHTGFIAMGTDVVAVDATCARAIGVDPFRLPYIKEAAHFVGNAASERIRHRGESPSRYVFDFDLIESMQMVRARQS
jgi:uncharacterized protein (DUF362 family)